MLTHKLLIFIQRCDPCRVEGCSTWSAGQYASVRTNFVTCGRRPAALAAKPAMTGPLFNASISCAVAQAAPQVACPKGSTIASVRPLQPLSSSVDMKCGVLWVMHMIDLRNLFLVAPAAAITICLVLLPPPPPPPLPTSACRCSREEPTANRPAPLVFGRRFPARVCR